MNNIKNFINNNLVDENYYKNNIIYSFSIINNDYFMFHIYNPDNEDIILNKNNEVFFKKIANMFFNKEDKKKGCFNHQQEENSILYKENIQNLINYFLNIEYSFVLVDLHTFIPLSIFCCIKNYIYNVCTDFDYRGNGHMSKLLDHYFLLVKKNKLKNGCHKEILLDIVFVNPEFKSVRKYYEENYNFKFLKENDSKVILKKIM